MLIIIFYQYMRKTISFTAFTKPFVFTFTIPILLCHHKKKVRFKPDSISSNSYILFIQCLIILPQDSACKKVRPHHHVIHEIAESLLKTIRILCYLSKAMKHIITVYNSVTKCCFFSTFQLYSKNLS